MLHCPLCKQNTTHHICTNEYYDYLLCNTCDLVFVRQEERLSPEEEKKRYDQHENNPNDDRYRNFLNQLFQPLNDKLTKKSLGLDYGSGPGPTLHLMFEEVGHSMEIFDPFYSNDKSVLNNTYDFITSTETVEHFYNPAHEFETLWSILKPGGFLGIMTLLRPEDQPLSEWHYIRDDTHVSLYSKKTFKWIANHFNTKLWFHGDRVIILQKSGN